MAKIFMRIGGAGVLMFMLAGQAVAVERTCRTEIVSAGSAAIREPRAREKAIESWRGQAVANHGIFFGNEKEANDGNGVMVERCARTLVGLYVCQARGRPCLVKQAAQSDEILCTLDDPVRCNANVKWVQRRLNDRGAKLTVDGLEGDETARAIRRYKRSKNMGDDNYIDDKLLEALKG